MYSEKEQETVHRDRLCLWVLARNPEEQRAVVLSFVSALARDGFSLNAAVAFKAHQHERIEGLCRYVTRPALALERLSQNGTGQWPTS